MRSLRSLGFLIPAKTILVPCIKQKMEVMENVSVKLRNTVDIYLALANFPTSEITDALAW